MAQVSELPCDGDGVCMVCKVKAAEGEIVTCKTCVAPWHVACLSNGPKTLGEVANWECPDCSTPCDVAVVVKATTGGGGLVEKIRAIENDATLTDREKAKRRQELLSGGNEKGKEKEVEKGIFGDKFDCSICMQLLDKPVTTPCGHNFCLKCFHKWVGQQGKKTCAICRKTIPAKMASEPRINSAIVLAIRAAKLIQTGTSLIVPKIHHVIDDENRPDHAFTTVRAKKSGNANACSGRILVTIPRDFLGPITAEYDPIRNTGVLVGETWVHRLQCRQWGAQFSHVSGICGQKSHGAQSVALSGGYEDDEDHGDWFLYTGSGGRDLTNNKRTNKKQSSEQVFTRGNQALRLSCQEGYPVRVVRSHKEKRSSYAPPNGVRYDGVYRVEKCWRKPGTQGFIVCRYLFIRCDNEPAPWTSDTHGDRPRSKLPHVAELKEAFDISERKGSPAWDYDEEQGRWVWKRPQPPSRKIGESGTTKRGKRQSPKRSVKARLLKEFSCLLCRKVMVQPVTTPCAHNFCKACLEGAFAGQSFLKERSRGGRTLRTQKNVMKCPSCKHDIAEFLQNPQVNRELMNVIESLENQMKENELEEKTPETEENVMDEDDEEEDDEEEDEDVEEEEEEEEEETTETEGNENGSAVEGADLKDSGILNVDLKEASDGTDGKSNIVQTAAAVKPKRSYTRKKAGKVSPNVDLKDTDEKSNIVQTAAVVKPKRSYTRKKAAEVSPNADKDTAVVKPKRSYTRKKAAEGSPNADKGTGSMDVDMKEASDGTVEKSNIVQTAAAVKPKRKYTRKNAAEVSPNADKRKRAKKTV